MRRRALLGAAALAATGCGKATGGEPPRAAERPGGDSTLADVALLQDALALERRSGDRAHVALIERAIRARRGTPAPLDPGPAPRDPAAAQEELVALYVDIVAKLSEPGLRAMAGGLLAGASRAAAEIRLAGGEDPAPSAFAAGLRPEEAR